MFAVSAAARVRSFAFKPSGTGEATPGRKWWKRMGRENRGRSEEGGLLNQCRQHECLQRRGEWNIGRGESCLPSFLPTPGLGLAWSPSRPTTCAPTIAAVSPSLSSHRSCPSSLPSLSPHRSVSSSLPSHLCFHTTDIHRDARDIIIPRPHSRACSASSLLGNAADDAAVSRAGQSPSRPNARIAV